MPEHKKSAANNQQQQQQQQSNSSPAPSPAITLLQQYEPIIASTAANVYETSLRAPIRLKVLDKLGVGRSGFRRSKELNAFRQQLKDTARQQAREDVTANIDKDPNFQQDEKLKKAKHTMIANSMVYDEAKTSVDDLMGSEADKILDRTLPSSIISPLLKAAAKSAIQDKMDHQKTMKTILDTAQKKADELYKTLEKSAIERARFIVKGNKDGTDASGRDAIVTQMKTDVKDKVKSDKIGENAVKASFTVDTFDSALVKIAPLIKQVVPYNGDSAELSLEIKIPIPPNGFVSIHLGTAAEHDDDHYKLGAEVNIGGGGTLKVVELKGSIGMFIEAQGKSEMDTLNLLSYGMYRHLSLITPSLSKRIWGLGKTTGTSRLEEAEVRAAVIEQKLLDDDQSYVSVGQQAAFDATVKTGIYEGNFQLKGQRKTTYNKDNLEALNSDEHYQKLLEKKDKDSIPTRLLQAVGLREADPNKKKSERKDLGLDDMTFGDQIEMGKDKMQRRALRYKEIEANKSLSVSTEHTLSLPHGSIKLGGGFGISGSEISGNISFTFPEKLKELKADAVFNHLFPKLTSITNSSVQLLVFNSNEEIKDVNDFEGVKIATTNAIQSVITSQNLEGAFEGLHDTSITGSLDLTYNIKEKKLEVKLKLTKDTSHAMKSMKALQKVSETASLDVVNFEYSKSSKIAEFKTEVAVDFGALFKKIF